MEAAEAALASASVKGGKKIESKVCREPASKQRTVINATLVHCAVALKYRELAFGATTSKTADAEIDIRNVVLLPATRRLYAVWKPPG